MLSPSKEQPRRLIPYCGYDRDEYPEPAPASSLSHRSEELLSYLTGLAPVGQALRAPGRQIAADLGWPLFTVYQTVTLVRGAGYIRLARWSEVGEKRGYVVLKRLETRA